ncbi:MAG: sulfatase [Defluviitaleaceae bacterium]|nr:sulfatase [Defluviitaleaceae bacterium]
MAKPNIIFILIDDMGWTDLGCFGSSFYETPNIDRLASEGMRFTDAYAACPVCSPSRASYMCGKYPAAIGVTDWIDHDRVLHPQRGILIDAPYIDHLPMSEKSVASALRDGGYATWHVGKWHLGDLPYYPQNHGFDVNLGGCKRGTPGKGYFSPYGIDGFADGPDGEYLTDRLTDEAVNLIKRHDYSKPFFLNMCHYAVHEPIQVKAADRERFEKKRIALGLDKLNFSEEGEVFPNAPKNNPYKIRRRLFQSDAGYAAMVFNLDENIGRLMDAVKNAGQENNTIVVFTSDNGGVAATEIVHFTDGQCHHITEMPTCNKPLSQGKGWMYEGGVREPLIVKWPGIVKPGTECGTPVTSPDFYPTFLQAAGLPLLPKQHRDGVSIMPLLTGAEGFDREAVYWHYPHYGNQGGSPAASVRKGDYKLIEFYEDNSLELYNLIEDIGELNNLANTLPDIVSDLHGLLCRWRDSAGALYPQKNPDW